MAKSKQRSIVLSRENERLLSGVLYLHPYLTTQSDALRYVLAKFALTREGKIALESRLEPDQDVGDG
jgi:hypothetical protein